MKPSYQENPYLYHKVPRTYDEAFRTPDYAIAIWGYKEESDASVFKAFLGLLAVLAIVIVWGVL